MIKKAALLIGINYKGTDSALNGCINDVHQMREYLVTQGYSHDSITVITEETAVKPTKDVIINAFLKLLQSDATQLFFHYSGHGSHTIDRNNEECDRQDECLVPLDYSRNGMITDDQLAGMLSFLRIDVKLHIILDCCHSGTGFDLCYTLTPIQKFIQTRNTANIRYIMKTQSVYPETNGQVVMISGCADDQTSADAYINKKYQGALTYALLKILKASPEITYLDLILGVKKLLKDEGYTQIPHMTSGRPLELSTTF